MTVESSVSTYILSCDLLSYEKNATVTPHVGVETSQPNGTVGEANACGSGPRRGIGPRIHIGSSRRVTSFNLATPIVSRSALYSPEVCEVRSVTDVEIPPYVSFHADEL
ncbi:hypothetical protein QAD02_012642 [Eretmocerus hayati]|nr:hypothetical protein QAD02_012642 [Eretmocerus hayati]